MLSVWRSTDPELGISILDCHGFLSGVDFQRFVTSGSQETAPRPDLIVDLSGIRSLNFKPRQIEEAAQAVMDSSRLAIVAPRPALFGFARMFQIHAEIAGRRRRIEVFKSREDAVDWLRGENSPAGWR